MPIPPRPVVIVFGRFNPPTIHHIQTIRYAQTVARRNRADVRVYPSYEQHPQDNPLPFRNKVYFLQKFFPAIIINNNPNIRTEYDVIGDIVKQGYTVILILVHRQHVNRYQKIARFLIPHQSPKYHKKYYLPICHYQVVGIPMEYDPDEENLPISSAKMREYAILNNFDAFAHAVPVHVTPQDVVNLFTQVRQYMGLRETFHIKPGQFAATIFEDEGSDTYIHLGGGDEDKDTEADRIRKVHQQELISMKQRQTSELNGAKMRDVQRKAREAQMKVTKPKGSSAG